MTEGLLPNGSQEPLSEADILNAMRAEIGMNLVQLLGLFAPSLLEAPNEEKLAALVEQLLQEQLVIQNQVIPALLSGEGAFHINVLSQNGTQGRFSAERLLSTAQGDCGKALATALVYAFTLQPAVRGLLRLHGVAYQFIAPPPKPGLKLIV